MEQIQVYLASKKRGGICKTSLLSKRLRGDMSTNNINSVLQPAIYSPWREIKMVNFNLCCVHVEPKKYNLMPKLQDIFVYKKLQTYLTYIHTFYVEISSSSQKVFYIFEGHDICVLWKTRSICCINIRKYVSYSLLVHFWALFIDLCVHFLYGITSELY